MKMKMRQKKLKMSVLLLLGLGLTGLKAQTMYVKENNGMQNSCELNSLRKLTFSDGNATIHKNDNSSNVYSLDGLSYISFINYSTDIKEQQLQNCKISLIAYPNPVTDILNIELKGFENENGIINILSIEGRILLTQRIKKHGILSINLSNFPKGIYLCRYVNGLETKVEKIIKK